MAYIETIDWINCYSHDFLLTMNLYFENPEFIYYLILYPLNAWIQHIKMFFFWPLLGRFGTSGNESEFNNSTKNTIVLVINVKALFH